jgi:uncharacterized protein YcnI
MIPANVSPARASGGKADYRRRHARRERLHGMLAIGLVLGLPATPVAAHIVFEQPSAVAGSYYKAVFRITHACGNSPIREIVVDIPDGVQGAKPMVKPGWTIGITRARLDKPYTALHGRVVTEEVRQVRWSGGSLPNEHYDEFALVGRLPDRPGPLPWKVSQICETGRIDWHQVPAPGQKASDLKEPAPVLEVLPAGGHAGHQH